MWRYDDGNLVATLERLVIVCPRCDAVQHFGRTQQLGREYASAALAHMVAVNQMKDLDEAITVLDAAAAEWRRRSNREWTIAVAAELLSRFPELSVVADSRGEARRGAYPGWPTSEWAH